MISNIIGENVTIQCTVILTTGIGPNVSSLIVNWYKDSEYVTQQHFTQKVSSKFISTLAITSLKTTNGGTYECEAGIVGNQLVSNTTDLCVQGTDHI